MDSVASATGGITINPYDGPIIFGTGGFATANERMRILVTGFVGIGTNAPDRMLEIKKTQNDQTFIRITNEDTTTSDYRTQAGVEFRIAGNTIGSLKTVAKNLNGLSAVALFLTTSGSYPLAFGTDDSPTPMMTIMNGTGAVKMRSLEGTGTRTVVVDANGVLSAP